MKPRVKTRCFRTWLAPAGAVVLSCGVVGSAMAQQLPPEALNLVRTWLVKNCEVGEARVLEQDLKKWGTRVEPAFLEAVKDGPDAKLLSEFEEAAAKRFDQRQELLKAGVGLGLSSEDLEAARRVTRDDFIAKEREDFVLRYKSQALAGLGIVGGAKAQGVLQGIARDSKSPLRGSAEQALKRLRSGK